MQEPVILLLNAYVHVCIHNSTDMSSVFTIPDTKQNKGFGYVAYSQRDDAESAVKKISSMDGRKLFVSFANKKPKKPKKKKDVKKQEPEKEDDDDGKYFFQI